MDIASISQITPDVNKIGMGSFARDLLGSFEKADVGFDQVMSKTADVGNALAKPISIEVNTADVKQKAPSIGSLFDDLIHSVDDKSKESSEALKQAFSGQSSNLHQTMIAMQESEVAFTLMLEVRNKLVEGFQELMKMSV
ncbi:MAG: flagellar hook-basal body complex protein FliE [Verrucomicrobia bacterium GWF2_51_19]|nr:MAG: flagellar hook-basal body complex protein FliE [Verrucomicrobia bacterium GWF2_51_19]HCJ12452.1 flagellar hook-basal body complex protein FliE [Opitutae bacterium]